jgi:glycerol-3-phosphate dehydrogenase
VRSIDAVKRRTRAGMGKCQGRFCRPRVARLLEGETGLAADKLVRDYEEHVAARRRVLTPLVRSEGWAAGEPVQEAGNRRG